ncbi:MAG: hypothetical protein LCH88_05335 [Proteobacteria bacterium]|nr:hypothetical protein [Pseudomonadota bacterium]
MWLLSPTMHAIQLAIQSGELRPDLTSSVRQFEIDAAEHIRRNPRAFRRPLFIDRLAARIVAER